MTLPTPNFDAITDLFTNTWTLGTGWLIPLAVAIIAMALITRDVKKWTILAFPIFVLQRIIGMPVHLVLLAFSAMAFAVEVLSTQLIGRMISAIKIHRPKSREERSLRKIGKRQKVLDFYTKAYEQEKAIFGKTKRTKGMSTDLLKEMRIASGFEKKPKRVGLTRFEKKLNKIGKSLHQGRVTEEELGLKRFRIGDIER